jgi:hypothetical protein
MHIVLVHAEFGAFNNTMDGASSDTNVSVDADSFNISGVGGECVSTEKDAVPVLAKTDRMLFPAVDSEAAN